MAIYQRILMTAVCGFAVIGGAYAARPWNHTIVGVMDAALHMPIIGQKGKVFSLAEVSEPVGATIRVVNDDDVPHTLRITAPDGDKSDFGLQKPGEYSDISLEKLGDYMARCNIHPNMKLVIHVH
jgi:plastocyanin